MTENKRPRRIVRGILVTVIIMALAVLTAVGANAASGGQLFAHLVSYHAYTDEDGTEVAEMEIEIDDDALANGGVGEFQITQDESGKAFMTYTDEDGNEVTQEIDLEEEIDGITNQIQDQAESQAE